MLYTKYYVYIVVLFIIVYWIKIEVRNKETLKNETYYTQDVFVV